MKWIYKEKEFEDNLINKNAIGFIYLITNLINGRKYIGKKLLTKASSETKILKSGLKKKVKCRKESDWKIYQSSCEELKQDIKSFGQENFTKEILCFTFSLTTHTYLENKYLYVNEVLESDQWYNGNISNKIFKNRIINQV